ncbi:hypothetical protein N826_25505 [Skermanella aerolata KACC 11604]|nr:hypothetical protein N826_25505 [Skermanella aerolata KACC 11604]
MIRNALATGADLIPIRCTAASTEIRIVRGGEVLETAVIGENDARSLRRVLPIFEDTNRARVIFPELQLIRISGNET